MSAETEYAYKVKSLWANNGYAEHMKRLAEVERRQGDIEREYRPWYVFLGACAIAVMVFVTACPIAPLRVAFGWILLTLGWQAAIAYEQCERRKRDAYRQVMGPPVRVELFPLNRHEGEE